MGAEVKKSGGPGMLWHYTDLQRLQRSLQDGELRPAASGKPSRVKPAVWFSSHPAWEASANRWWHDDVGGRNVRLNKDQTHVLGGGLARIGVAPEVAPHDWKAYRRLSGISAERAKAIYDEAVSAGARPGEWFATFDAVGRAKWLAVEILENENWVPYRLATT
jgi:hypothetical protein